MPAFTAPHPELRLSSLEIKSPPDKVVFGGPLKSRSRILIAPCSGLERAACIIDGDVGDRIVAVDKLMFAEFDAISPVLVNAPIRELQVDVIGSLQYCACLILD